MICLDTNVVISAINNRPPALRERIAQEIEAGGKLALPTIVIFEMLYGIAKSRMPDKSLGAFLAFMSLDIETLVFDSEDAGHAADIRASLEKSGTPIGAYDILIGAQARRRNATLVTANRREFARIPKLHSVTWP